jgi:WD40 repeat protein
VGTGAEDLDQLRDERDRLLAERERLRQKLNEPLPRPPRIPPNPPEPPAFPLPPPAGPDAAGGTGPPSPSRRRLLVGTAAAVVAAAVAVPAGIALFGDGTDDAKGTARTKQGEDASGSPSPAPIRTPPPVAIPARPELRLLATLKGHRGEIGTLCFSPDGKTLASSESQAGVVRLWDVNTHKERANPLFSALGVVESLSFSPDGRTLATGTQSRAQFWDAATLRPRGHEIAEHNDSSVSFQTVVFSPDGKILATGGGLGSQGIQLYDTGTRRQRGAPLSLEHEAFRLVFSPDGKTLASVDESGSDGVRLWDVATRKQRPQPAHDFFGGDNIMVFSRDSKTLAVVNDPAVNFFDTATGKENGKPLYGGTVTSLAYSTDGKSLLTTDFANLHIWDASTHKRKATAAAPGTAAIAQTAFSPDGRTLATVGFQDKTIHLWRLV